MGFFGGLKSALGTPSSGGLLNYALSGSKGVDRSKEAKKTQVLQSLLAAMPLSNDYAPASHAAPSGEADPLADVPLASRQQAWLRDFAAAGGQVPLSALMPTPKDRARQIINTRKGVYAIDPDQEDAKLEPLIEFGPDPMAELDRAYKQSQIDANAALIEQRKHSAGKPYFAPGRPRAAAAKLNPSSVQWD